MSKYLFQGSFTDQGVKGVLKEGGSGRRRAVEQLAQGMGGTVEAFYFAFGTTDFFVVLDLPSSVDAAAVSMAVNASGVLRASTTVLITPEEMDAATKKTVNYRPPGQ